MNKIFKYYDEYIDFCITLFTGRYYVFVDCFKTIDKIITAQLMYAPLKFEFENTNMPINHVQPKTWADAINLKLFTRAITMGNCYMFGYTSENALLLEYFPKINIIEVLIRYCKRIKFAYELLQYIFRCGYHIPYDPSIISFAVKNYANYVKFITSGCGDIIAFKAYDDIFTPSANTFIEFVIDNMQKEYYEEKNNNVNMDVNMCDVISCANVKLLQQMFNNKNIKLSGIVNTSTNCLIKCANENNIIASYKTIPGPSIECERHEIDITKFYIEIAKFMFKHDILLVTDCINTNISEIKNNAMANCFSKCKLKHDIMCGVVLSNIPTCIKGIILNYYWSY